MISNSTGAERKTCDAVHQTARALVFAEDILQQLRSVSDLRLIADISRSGHRHAQTDDARYFIERSQMLLRDHEDVERRVVSRLGSFLHPRSLPQGRGSLIYFE